MSSDLLVCGLPRSGTSLTRNALAAHPAFAVPRLEMAWWTTLYPRFRGRPDGWAGFLTTLRADPKTRSLDLDQDALTAALSSVPVGAHLAAFDAVLRQFAAARRRPRWGEKTLFAERHAPAILEALPDVRILHLVRDPRDMLASLQRAPWRTATGPMARARGVVSSHAGWVMRQWRTSVTLAAAHAARFPARYRVLRYEDLVRAPEATLDAVCAFAGVPYDRRMLALDAFPDTRQGNSSFGPLTGISTAPVGRFEALLPARTVALCETLLGDELQRWGYARHTTSLGASTRLRLRLLDRPVAAGLARLHDTLGPLAPDR